MAKDLSPAEILRLKRFRSPKMDPPVYQKGDRKYIRGQLMELVAVTPIMRPYMKPNQDTYPVAYRTTWKSVEDDD
jgi:hypothetical protein